MFIAKLYSKTNNCYSISNERKYDCSVYWYKLAKVRKYSTKQKCRNAIKEIKETKHFFDRIFLKVEIVELTEELEKEALFLGLKHGTCTL